MVLVDVVSFQYAVLVIKPRAAFGEKHLVAELDGLLSLARLIRSVWFQRWNKIFLSRGPARFGTRRRA